MKTKTTFMEVYIMSIMDWILAVIMIITMIMIGIAIIGTGIAGIYELAKLIKEAIEKAQS